MTITTDGTNHFLGSLYFNASTLAIAQQLQALVHQHLSVQLRGKKSGESA